ncbi:MAG: hypothetical protein QF824_05395 [Candidatus Woesearchaeota archaeon]|jgi:polyhydroxyalkanoate synthesis regulator phasin|nr:hypothetical protein [Candidatus Woesearchaeota archaeon]
MKKLVQKSVLLGLGAASLTRKKVVQLVGPLVKEKLLSNKDAMNVVKKVMTEGAREKKRIDKIISVELNKAKSVAKKTGVKARKGARAVKRVAKTGARKVKRAAKALRKR